MAGEAMLDMNARIRVWVLPEDIRNWSGYEEAVRSGMSKEDILRNVAAEKLAVMEGQSAKVDYDAATIMNDTINWDEVLHPTEPTDNAPMESLSAKKEAADSNPAQKVASDALKIAKELSNLLNSLAGLQNREEIAQAAGLQNLPEAIEALYALADQYRAGGIQTLAPAQAQYSGWDPVKLAELGRTARPFVDQTSGPVETVVEDAEKFRFPNQKTECPQCVDVPMSVGACTHGTAQKTREIA